MTTQHTPGRLRYDYEPGFCGELIASNGTTVCTFIDEPNEANARRLVAAWNACEGLTTEHLENIDMLGETLSGQFAAFHASERELMDTRNELLAVLKLLCSRIEVDGATPLDSVEYYQARAAIAKAEGGAK